MGSGANQATSIRRIYRSKKPHQFVTSATRGRKSLRTSAIPNCEQIDDTMKHSIRHGCGVKD
jgi:hypothetical protein